MAKANILIAEDDGIVAMDIKSRLKNLGYSVSAIVSSGKEAVKKVKENHPDLVLMDIVLKDEMDGIEAADKIRTQFRVPVVYLTAYADDKLLARAKITEPFGYIIKPFEDRELHSAIEIALYKHKAEEALQKAHDGLEKRVRERTFDLNKANEQLIQEIEERKIAEKALRESEEQFRLLFETLESGFTLIEMIYDVNDRPIDCRYVTVNPSHQKHSGLHPAEIIGKTAKEVFGLKDEWIQRYGQVDKIGKPIKIEDYAEGLGKWFRVVAYRPKPGFVAVIFEDITESKKLQQQLIQSEKLASMGELAAGVAHEINNPINGIINYAQILIDGLGGQTDEDGIPARIMKEAERIASIVKNMLAFVRETDDVLSTVSVKNIFADILQLVETRLSNDGIQLKLGILDDLPMVNVNSQKIQQVFMNLISNARYALNEKYKGSHKNKVLRLEGEVHEIDGKVYCRITFHDTGAGIPPDEIDKVCAPFFTTKPNGEGTGLGLSISCGIIRDHGGHLSFESETGEYTKAIVDLPAMTQIESNSI